MDRMPWAQSRAARTFLVAISAIAWAACDSESFGPAPAPTGPAIDDAGTPSSGSQPESPPGSLTPEQVDTLFLSAHSGAMTPRRQLVRSPDAWADAWSEISGTLLSTDPAPEVDFATSQVLVIAMGVRPTGGYAIEVRQLSLADGVLSVPVREVAPGPSCITTQATTQPAVVLRVPRLGDTVDFVEERAVLDCG